MVTLTEKVHFRLLVMSGCCGTQLCWVNPRLPSFCPECGKRCYPEVKSQVTMDDDKAILKVKG